MRRLLYSLFIVITIVTGCHRDSTQPSDTFTTQLAGYEPMVIPPDNPMTPENVALGRQLFFDERLSFDGSRSCYSCHVCEHGLTDGLPKAIGAGNTQLTRSSPTLWNIGYHKEFYWDGRSGSLEKQALAAWTGGNMGANADEIVAKLNVVKAIAAYERTIIGGNTAWDRWKAGDNTALSRSAWRGWNIFQAIHCNNCHDGILFTDQQYHNIGIGMDQQEPDLGRFNVTKRPEDTGAFKTPTLRDIAKSAPYFHDGSAKTLEEAVDIMLGGGKPNKYLDKKNLEPHKLMPDQREDLSNFLRSLTVDCNLTKPPLPHK